MFVLMRGNDGRPAVAAIEHSDCLIDHARGAWSIRYLAVVACFALGLMAKPMLVVCRGSCCFWIIGRLTGREHTAARVWQRHVVRILVGKLRLLLMAGISSAVTIQGHRHGEATTCHSTWAKQMIADNACPDL